MKGFISLAFLAYTLLFLTVVSADNEPTFLNKRSFCVVKRNVLGKRTLDIDCPCATAEAIFDEKIKGHIVFAQDECGDVKIAGLFTKGLNNKPCTFKIVDECGVVHDLTSTLKVIPTKDGGSKPFKKKYTNFNLNCDYEGIFIPRTCDYPGESGLFVVINDEYKAPIVEK
ncbi:11772_t:CDS:1 [Funneliformis caledonium]|uniref:11772_t:CDS:1 n=2 Tax=Funneliformis TaxID=1117308 RepID=A0A9N8YQU5_9GLOM|nr:11772_t:CDS:1 [Funneliformis caledonium]CAG8464992.1 2306_t:CDS:1 [Funneliformis mosseae]